MPDNTQTSQSNPSETPKVVGDPTPEELAAVKEEQDKAAEKQLNETSKKSAKNDDYDPAIDPIVPDSQLADIIRVELQIGESPTLDGLRAAAKDAKKNE